MIKPETIAPALAICSDCAWPDTCREDGLCTRARLTVIGFDTGMTTARAFELLGDDALARIDAGRTPPPPSAIIEPPTKAQLMALPSAWHTITRTQIRAAIAEVFKAQADIKAAVESDSQDVVDPALVAMGVLDALPEAIAFHFGLNIRGACAECDAPLFKEEPYTSNAEGKPTCEAHAAPDAA